MKPQIIVCIFVSILACFLTAKAQTERYVTVTVGTPTVYATNDGYYYFRATNIVEVGEGEAGELVTICYGSGGAHVQVSKNGITKEAYLERRTIVSGPASFILQSDYFSSVLTPRPDESGIMTVRITPQTFAADKTLLVSPGMGNVQINLESSTNLTSWATATNGVYSEDMRFFRIKLTKAN